MQLLVNWERQRLLWRRPRRWPRSSCRKRVRIEFPFDKFLFLAKIYLQKSIQGEEDIEEETGIIRVQLGYVMQRLGREKEAATIYNQVELFLSWIKCCTSKLSGNKDQSRAFTCFQNVTVHRYLPGLEEQAQWHWFSCCSVKQLALLESRSEHLWLQEEAEGGHRGGVGVEVDLQPEEADRQEQRSPCHVYCSSEFLREYSDSQMFVLLGWSLQATGGRAGASSRRRTADPCLSSC